jgi:hypothetical protein
MKNILHISIITILIVPLFLSLITSCNKPTYHCVETTSCGGFLHYDSSVNESSDSTFDTMGKFLNKIDCE